MLSFPLLQAAKLLLARELAAKATATTTNANDRHR